MGNKSFRSVRGVWYRHSGQAELSAIPHPSDCRFTGGMNDREILEDIGAHHITHMYVRGGNVPSLNLVAPKLRALKIERIVDSSQLYTLSSLAQLEYLNLSNNNFNDGLCDVFGALESLKELNLANCRLRDLPTSISSLAQLEYLNLSNNNFNDGLCDVFGALESLKELDLANCRLRDLPTSLSSLTLKVLSLQNNILDGSLEEFGMLTSLEELTLDYCDFTSLPECVSSLTNLKLLSVCGNKFSDGLPQVIGELTSLEALDLRKCELTDLPASISSLTQLKLLSLYDNDFCHGLPDAIGTLVSLEVLDLKACGLKTLPPFLSSLTQLKRLNLPNNKFCNGFPEVIGTLTSLEELNMEQCELENMPTSMSTLSCLKLLNLRKNDFSAGLPEQLGMLSSLETLDLSECQLTNLPAQFGSLTKLEKLWLAGNHFKYFPTQICQLVNLTQLYLNQSKQLEALHPAILHLSKLKYLNTFGCPSLTTPPPNVFRQGVEAIQQYYKDLEKGLGKSLPAATVSVIGKTKAGKTSLIRTLQRNERVLTGSVGTGEDVSTKVFNFEEVEVENTKLRFIDFGGQEIYHLAYGLTLRENCIPVIVVNMEMYLEMSSELGDREAVRRLYFDWMAHLYLSQPDLPAPKLVITHKDKFSSVEFEEIKSRFLANSTSVRDSILSEESRLKSSEFHQIRHISASAQMFHENNIFEVGSEDDQDTFQRLKQQLLDHCKRYVMEVPRIWEEVEQSIQAIPTGFSRFDDLLPQLAETHEVEKEHLEIILTYMHYCGKLLWYKDIKGLSSYVFHKISAVTKLVNVLLDHDDARKWEERLEKFENCKILSHNFQRQSYLQSVEKFKATGIVSSMLLAYLIYSETEFNSDEKLKVALELLTTFRLAIGEVKFDGEPVYIVPYFAVGYLPALPTTKSDIQLHVDLVWKGLPLPLYVYHEMTAGALELLVKEHDSCEVSHNGARIEGHDCTVSFAHDAKAGKATVFVSCNVDVISESWHQLVNVVNNTIQHVSKTWKAARVACVSFCGHCKLIGSSHPRKIVNPSWCELHTAEPEPEYSELKMVSCGKESVPSALRFPCQSLSEIDKQALRKYVKNLMRQKRQMLKQGDTAGANANVKHLAAEVAYGAYSLSDIADILHNMKLTRTQDESIKILYHNADLVYKMTSPRGMALIINNNKFYGGEDSRKGSMVDVGNLERMLTSLDFEVQTLLDLSCDEMLNAIGRIAMRDEELEDYGMFILVLMSLGNEGDQVYGTDGHVIDLSDVFHLLSSANFPAMAGKPKFVVVGASGGARRDFGEQGRHIPKVTKSIRTPEVKLHPRVGAEINSLDRDDLIVIKASFDTYASLRHDNFGSPFISCLVHHFYKYACDRDVETLCKMIQYDVRRQSIQLAKENPRNCYGQVPFYFSTLTKLRKVYLFPGYDGE